MIAYIGSRKWHVCTVFSTRPRRRALGQPFASSNFYGGYSVVHCLALSLPLLMESDGQPERHREHNEDEGSIHQNDAYPK